MTDLPEFPGWVLAYAPMLLNVAFWVIIGLCTVVSFLVGLIWAAMRWWFRGFLKRMSQQDAALETIQKLLTREISTLTSRVQDNTTRIVCLEEWRSMFDDYFKRGRRRDDV